MRDELRVDEDDIEAAAAALAGCTPSSSSPRCTSRRCGRWPTRGRPGRRSSRRSRSTSTPRRPRRCRPSGTAVTSRVPLKALDSPYREITRPDRRVRQVDAVGQPARPRRRLHPRVRPRPLVGAGAAQPERPAPQGPAALHTRRHGLVGAVAARLGRGPGGPASTAPSPATSAAATTDAPDPPAASTVGEEVEVDVRPVAHGGHAVARHEGQVLFVRHALPGERVRAVVTVGRPASASSAPTPSRSSTAAPDRVEPPCPYAGPGRCGGCDFQHVVPRRPARAQGRGGPRAAVPARARSRSTSRSSRSPVTTTASTGAPASSSPSTPTGRAGLRRHRSHDVVPVDHCLIAAPRASTGCASPRPHWPGRRRRRRGRARRGRAGRRAGARRRPAGPSSTSGSRRRGPGPTGRPSRSTGGFAVDARGFWQVHPGAAPTFLAAVMAEVAAAAGGAGPRPLLRRGPVRRRARRGRRAHRPGRRGRVRRRRPPSTPAANLADQPQVAVVTARVDDAFGVPRPARKGPGRRGSTRRTAPPGRPCCRPRPTSSSSTRRAPAPVAGSAPRSRACDRASSPTSPATRPRWRATPPSSPGLGYRARRACAPSTRSR